MQCSDFQQRAGNISEKKENNNTALETKARIKKSLDLIKLADYINFARTMTK